MMDRCLTLLLFILLIFKVPEAHAMYDYAWKYRLILVKAPERTNSDFQDQMERLEAPDEEAAITDRQILPIALLSNKRVAEYAHNPYQKSDLLPLPAYSHWLESYGATLDQNDFAVVLIGLDTGVKAVWEVPVSMQDIYERIDAMPMRRRELQ